MADTATTAVSRQYEIMFIVAGSKTDEVVRDVHNTVKEEITARGGEVKAEDVWGLREFAYPLWREVNGYYTVLHFMLPTTKVSDLSKHLRLNTNMLRFLITSVPENYKFLTQAQLREKSKKTEKGRDADTISAESKTMGTRPLRPRTSRPSTTAAPVTAAKPAPVIKMEPAKPVEPKAPPKVQSDEERLKELDTKLGELLKDEEI